jgi:iron complex outermembrane receptor protein
VFEGKYAGALIVGATLSMTVTAAWVSPASAQTATAITYNIPPGPLAGALQAFGRVSGASISFDPALVRGRPSTGLKGRYAPPRALTILLRKTGLAATGDGKGGYVVTASARSAGPSSLQTEESVTAEIIVTANTPTAVGKLDVPLREQPQNVSVISRDTLDNFGKPRLQDLAYATVGLAPVALAQGVTSYGFFLRGFNGAPIIIDGYYSGNNAFGSVAVIDLATIQSVEVLRGPAALLYGQGNPGGVVNLTSKRPQAAFGLNLTLNADEIGTRRGELDLTGPVADGINARLVGVVEDSDGFNDFITQTRYLIAPSLSAQVTPSLKLNLQYVRDDLRFVADNDPGYVEELIRNLPVGRSLQEPGLPRNRVVSQYFRGELDWEIATGWKARIGYFRHRNRMPWGNRELDPDVPEPGSTLVPRYLSTSIDADHNGGDDEMLTAQLLGSFATGPVSHKFTVAGDLINNDSKYDYAVYSYFPIDYVAPVYQSGPVVADPANLLFTGEGAFKSKVRAIYAQDMMSIGDFKLLVGARVEKLKTTGYSDPAATIVTTADKASRVTPRLGLLYNIDPLTTVYASYSQAFVPQYGRNRANEPFEPEISRSYEIGLRRQFGTSLLLTVAAYDIRKKNILVIDPVTVGGEEFNINAGIARSRGLEVELKGQVTQDLSISTGFAYTNARIVKSVDPLTFPEGDRLPSAAKWSALLNLEYAFPRGALEGLSIGGNLSYASRRPYVLPNVPTELPAYARADLFATYQVTPALEVQINLSNLTNERIVLANGYGRAQFDTPRTIGATLRYRLGSLQ